MQVLFQGGAVTLKGIQLKEGDQLPDFTLTDNGLGSVSRKELTGMRVFVTVPSLDTGVCDLEVRNFNAKASALTGVHIYAVSMDLPFAQARWCGVAGVDAVKTLSDYHSRSFGIATGTLIEELMLLTRAVFIVDATDTVVYAEYVPEITNHPEYERIYTKLTELCSGT